MGEARQPPVNEPLGSPAHSKLKRKELNLSSPAHRIEMTFWALQPTAYETTVNQKKQVGFELSSPQKIRQDRIILSFPAHSIEMKIWALQPTENETGQN